MAQDGSKGNSMDLEGIAGASTPTATPAQNNEDYARKDSNVPFSETPLQIRSQLPHNRGDGRFGRRLPYSGRRYYR